MVSTLASRSAVNRPVEVLALQEELLPSAP
jgi:hypothetical protein